MDYSDENEFNRVFGLARAGSPTYSSYLQLGGSSEEWKFQVFLADVKTMVELYKSDLDSGVPPIKCWVVYLTVGSNKKGVVPDYNDDIPVYDPNVSCCGGGRMV